MHQHYIGLVNNILDLPAYRLHAKALAAIPYPRLAVASMLLRQTLPGVAAALEARSSPAPHERGSIGALEAHVLLGATADALRRAPLLPAVAQLSHQPGSHFVPLAGRIIRALPTSVEGLPSGVAPGELGNAHCNAAKLLGGLCVPLFPENWALEAPSAGQPGPSSGSGSGGGSSARAGAAASDASGSSGPAASAAHPGSERQRLAAWEVVRLVPNVALVLRQLAAGGSSACTQDRLAGAFAGYAAALQLVGSRQGGIRSWDELGAWAAAADAELRLLPLLADLDARWRHLAPAEQPCELLRTAPCELSLQLVSAVWQRAASAASVWVIGDGVDEPAAAIASEAPAALSQRLWQLHSTACRMVLWLAARSSDMYVQDWCFRLQALNLQAFVACTLADEATGRGLGRCAANMLCLHPPPSQACPRV